jgi:O-antigen/teichoic acid export membrane protein
MVTKTKTILLSLLIWFALFFLGFFLVMFLPDYIRGDETIPIIKGVLQSLGLSALVSVLMVFVGKVRIRFKWIRKNKRES